MASGTNGNGRKPDRTEEAARMNPTPSQAHIKLPHLNEVDVDLDSLIEHLEWYEREVYGFYDDLPVIE